VDIGILTTVVYIGAAEVELCIKVTDYKRAVNKHCIEVVCYKAAVEEEGYYILSSIREEEYTLSSVKV
jgi:hypothetical protein